MNSANLSMIRQLARAGDTERAWEIFVEAGLITETTHADTLTLKGRLLKDRALKAPVAARSSLLLAARQAYLHAADQSPATYPLINAATIALLDGDRVQAAEVAGRILAMLDSGNHEAETAYWLAATRAEACLLLGRSGDAKNALAEAMRQAPRAWEDHAATLRHFRLIHETLGEDTDWLDAYRPPASLHFSGIIHIAPDPAGSGRIREAATALRPGFAFGALAAGADIMAAELLLEQGAELHVVLPATVDAFRLDSVHRFGTAWEARFDALLEAAATIQTLDMLDSVSQSGIHVSDEIAMGMTIRQAAMLESTAAALRIGESGRAGGSVLDAAWQKRELPMHRVTLDRSEPPGASALPVYAREAVIALPGRQATSNLAYCGGQVESRAGSTIARFAEPAAAARAALAEIQERDGPLGIVYGAFDPANDSSERFEAAIYIAGTGHPGRIPISRAMAMALALGAPDLRCENFGTIASAHGDIALSMLVPI